LGQCRYNAALCPTDADATGSLARSDKGTLNAATQFDLGSTLTNARVHNQTSSYAAVCPTHAVPTGQQNDVTAPGKKRTNDDEGKTSKVRVKKQKTTRRKPQKRSKKQPQHVLADDTGHEADNQTSSGTFL
jgi:hypothetical protein